MTISCHHHLPGRTRLEIKQLKKNGGLEARLRYALKSYPAVRSFRLSSKTGRILLYYDFNRQDLESILGDLEQMISEYDTEYYRETDRLAEKNTCGHIPGDIIETEDLPVRRQIFNVALGGAVLAFFTARRLTGRTASMAGSPFLFHLAAATTIISGYPLFKSSLASLSQNHKINHDAILSALSLALILLRESIPGLTVVWLANLISLIETLVLRTTINFSREVAQNNNTVTEMTVNRSGGSEEHCFIESHLLTEAARSYAERMSSTSLWLAALSGLRSRDISKVLAILLASSPGPAGQAFPSSMAGAAALAARHGILVKNNVSIARAAHIKTVVFTRSYLLAAAEGQIGLVLPAAGVAQQDLLPLAVGMAKRSRYFGLLINMGDPSVREINIPSVMDFQVEIDSPDGIKARMNDIEMLLGWREFIEEHGIDTGPAEFKIRRLNRLCQAPLLLAVNHSLYGVLGLQKTVTEECRQLLYSLQAIGVSPLLITPENVELVYPVQAQLPLEAIAESDAAGAVEIMSELRRERGPLAIVGAVREDALLFREADLAIITGSAADSLWPGGDILIKSGDLRDIFNTIKIGRLCYEKSRQNLLGVTGLNLLGLALASAGRLSPTGAAIFSNLTSIAVSVNSLRLIGIRANS